MLASFVFEAHPFVLPTAVYFPPSARLVGLLNGKGIVSQQKHERPTWQSKRRQTGTKCFRVSDRVRVMISTLAMSTSSIPLSTMLLSLLSSRSKRMKTAALHKHEDGHGGSKLTFEFWGSNCLPLWSACQPCLIVLARIANDNIN